MVDMVKGGMSYGDAHKAFNMLKTTLKDRVKGSHGNTPSRPPVLDMEEESITTEMVKLLFRVGFSL